MSATRFRARCHSTLTLLSFRCWPALAALDLPVAIALSSVIL